MKENKECEMCKHYKGTNCTSYVVESFPHIIFLGFCKNIHTIKKRKVKKCKFKNKGQ
jgi:hypothetical protein